MTIWRCIMDEGDLTQEELGQSEIIPGTTNWVPAIRVLSAALIWELLSGDQVWWEDCD